MERWNDFWNPAAALGAAGAIGLVACFWSAAQRWIAPWCVVALTAAALSWSEGGIGDSGHELIRATFTISLVWGTLLTALNWPSVARKPVDESQSSGVVNSPLAPTSDGAMSAALPLQFVLLSALCWMAQAGDVVTLFLGLQLVFVGTNVLALTVASAGSSVDARCPAPWLLLLGLALLTAITGSTRIETISEALQSSYVNRESARYAIAGGGSRLLSLSAVLVGAALAGHAICAPFHFQFLTRLSPSTTSDERLRLDLRNCPTALLLPRAAVLIAWLKLWPIAIAGTQMTAQLLVGVLSAITMVLPLLQARIERNLIRQWLLLSIAQGGWLLLALASRSFEQKASPGAISSPIIEWNLPTASQSAWLLLLIDGVAVIGLFGVLSYLRRRNRSVEFVDDLRGLFHDEPLASICACVCLFSLSGVPLLAGFWSRLFVALVAMNVRGEWGPPHLMIPHNGLLLLTALLALGSVWSASIAMRSVWVIMFGLPLGKHRPAGAVSSLFAAVLASVILVGCGILPGPLLSWLCSPHPQSHESPESQKTPTFGVRGAPM